MLASREGREETEKDTFLHGELKRRKGISSASPLFPTQPFFSENVTGGGEKGKRGPMQKKSPFPRAKNSYAGPHSHREVMKKGEEGLNKRLFPLPPSGQKSEPPPPRRQPRGSRSRV